MIRVNGREIAAADVLNEAQHHPAPSFAEAEKAAAEALVVRELLLQRAERLGVPGPRASVEAEEAAIDAVLRRDVVVPTATPEECRRWYDANPKAFVAPPLFEAAHILYLAPRDDDAARASARARADVALARVSADPRVFGAIARAESACASAGEDGRLGQVAPGETCAEIDTFLAALDEGQICPVPVETDYGVHVLRLDRRIEGRTIAFEDAAGQVAAELQAHAFRKAVVQYIALLAREAEIEGVAIRAADSPLVQ